MTRGDTTRHSHDERMKVPLPSPLKLSFTKQKTPFYSKKCLGAGGSHDGRGELQHYGYGSCNNNNNDGVYLGRLWLLLRLRRFRGLAAEPVYTGILSRVRVGENNEFASQEAATEKAVYAY